MPELQLPNAAMDGDIIETNYPPLDDTLDTDLIFRMDGLSDASSEADVDELSLTDTSLMELFGRDDEEVDVLESPVNFSMVTGYLSCFSCLTPFCHPRRSSTMPVGDSHMLKAIEKEKEKEVMSRSGSQLQAIEEFLEESPEVNYAVSLKENCGSPIFTALLRASSSCSTREPTPSPKAVIGTKWRNEVPTALCN